MIYLVRHAQTDWNTKHLIQGRENVPLNSIGMKEALEAGKQFDGAKINYVLTSPLSRAKNTAKLMLKNAKVDHFNVDERLIEYDFGSRDGTPIAMEVEEFPDDEEDLEAFENRILGILTDAANLEGNVVLVTHGAVISSILNMLLPPEYSNVYIPLRNCSVNLIDTQQLGDGQIGLSLVGLDVGEEELRKALEENAV